MPADFQRPHRWLTFWVLVRVDLHEGIPPDADDPEDDDLPIVGNYRTFGVTAYSEDEARTMVLAAVSDGEVDWADSEISRDRRRAPRRHHSCQVGGLDGAGRLVHGGRILDPADL